MIIEIENKLVSAELFQEEFVCNLSACKGACCGDGNDGAPLTNEEADVIAKHINQIKPYVAEKGKKEIDKKGVSYLDSENTPVTMLVKGKECVFTNFEDGTARCGIELAYRDGKIPFNKPVSCHLYPIRVNELSAFTALNYDRWPICADACKLGKELKVPVYKFLKDAIIRAYGENFYKEMDKVAEELKKQNTQ